jgi:hypothetical protein
MEIRNQLIRTIRSHGEAWSPGNTTIVPTQIPTDVAICQAILCTAAALQTSANPPSEDQDHSTFSHCVAVLTQGDSAPDSKSAAPITGQLRSKRPGKDGATVITREMRSADQARLVAATIGSGSVMDGTEILPDAIKMISDHATGDTTGATLTDKLMAPIVAEWQFVELMKRIKGEQTKTADSPED